MLALTIALLLSTSEGSAAASDPVERISAYQGSWRAVVERRETEFSHAGHDERLIANQCRRAGVFYVCDQSVNGIEKALIAYRWNSARNSYDTCAVPANGGAPSQGTLEIDGDEWKYPWDQAVSGSEVHFRVVNDFVGRGRIQYRREFSRDGRDWTVIEEGTETKVRE